MYLGPERKTGEENMMEERKRGDESVPRRVLIEIEMPTWFTTVNPSSDLDKFSLPKGVNEQLQFLLDRQDQGEYLTPAERMEAEGLVNLVELLSLLRLRAQRVLTVHEVLLRYRTKQNEEDYGKRIQALIFKEVDDLF